MILKEYLTKYSSVLVLGLNEIPVIKKLLKKIYLQEMGGREDEVNRKGYLVEHQYSCMQFVWKTQKVI